MIVIGIKCVGHDTGAAILSDNSGVLKYNAIAESRLNRYKHSYQFPLLSIKYCLEAFGLDTLDDVDLIFTALPNGEAQDLSKYLNELGNPYSKIGMDTYGEASIEWGVYGLPETFIIDAEGTVLFRFNGPLIAGNYAQRFLPELEKALQKK